MCAGCMSDEWPDRAISHVESRIDVTLRGGECYESTRTPAEVTSTRRYVELFDPCQMSVRQEKLIVTDETVTGIYRCNVRDQIGEISITAYRDRKNAFGYIDCNYAFFDRSLDVPIGDATRIYPPEPGR